MTMSQKLLLSLGLILFCHSACSAPSLQCARDIAAYIAGITPLSPQMWALRMLDSSAKFPNDGVLQGSFIIQFGHYDQCLATQGPVDDDGVPRFRGQYCRVQLGFKTKKNNTDPKSELLLAQMKIAYDSLNETRGGANYFSGLQLESKEDVYLPAQWGVCAPSSCNADGVKQIADFNIGLLFSALNIDVSSKVAEGSCHYEDDGSKDLSGGAWAFIIFTLCLTFILVFTTAVEYMWPKEKDLNVFIKAFSLRTNFVELFTLPKKKLPGQLTCLNGLRVFSTWWVILLHCYMINAFLPHINAAMAVAKYPHQWTAAPLLSGGLSVDTFFFLGGLLTVYVPLMDQKKGRPFNIFKYYIYRYLRITLPVAMVLFYLATVHKLMSHGPAWDLYVEIQAKKCEKNWWATLLHIVNYYYPAETTCIGQAWYLMVDMQLALLSPIVIYPFLKWPKIGLALTSVLTLGSMAAAFAYTYIYKFPWTIVFLVPVESTGNFTLLVYANTLVRATPYLLGMILAYILANKITFKMPKWLVLVEWLLNTALCLTLVYIIVIPYSRDYVYEELGAAFFAAFHRVGWSIGIGWIIWACVNGYAGPVDSILSWKYFVPLSKLSFCAYLVHMDLMYFHVGLLKTNPYFSHFEMVYEYFGNLIMMIPLTMFLYLAVDAPTQTLLKALFKKSSAPVQRVTERANEKEVKTSDEALTEDLEEIKSRD